MTITDTHRKLAVGDTAGAWRRIQERQAQAAVVTPKVSNRQKWTLSLSVGVIAWVVIFWTAMTVIG